MVYEQWRHNANDAARNDTATSLWTCPECGSRNELSRWLCWHCGLGSQDERDDLTADGSHHIGGGVFQ